MSVTRMPSYLGRVMRTKEGPRMTCLVVGTSVGDKADKVMAHLMRIDPKPVTMMDPLPLAQLEEAEHKRAEGSDALTHLACTALETSLESEGALFFGGAEFKAYQFRPLVKYLKSKEKRILIADETGLGKTVEAAYIMLEEMASHSMERVLVVCPASLRAKWQRELWSKFGMRFEITGGSSLRRKLEGSAGLRAIASFDSLKGDAVPRIGPIDLLVIDEVHHMIGRAGDTLRRTMGLELSRRSSRVVALSATPIQLDFDDLRRVLEVVSGRAIAKDSFERDIRLTGLLNRFYGLAAEGGNLRAELSRLLPDLSVFVGEDVATRAATIAENALSAPEPRRREMLSELSELLEAADPFSHIVTRTRRRDVGEYRTRRIEDHPVVLDAENGNPTEKELYGKVDQFLKDSFTAVHRRQLASCLPAMGDLLRGGMMGFNVWLKEDAPIDPLQRSDEDEEAHFSLYRRELSQQERLRSGALADQVGAVATDSKWEVLRRILTSIAQGSERAKARKAVVFTQWIPTLRYLARRSMELPFRAFSTSGEDNEWQLANVLERFAEHDGPAVLFTTDLLSEGLDLQYADAVINYDFPYNPQRIEQRIGRVDRVGQTAASVDVHNLWVEGSVDEDVIAVDKGRLRVFAEALGDVSAVFGGATWGVAEARPEKEYDKAKAIERLNKVGIFCGVEDFLDGAVFEMRARRSGGFHRLAWRCVARALTLCSGLGATLDDGPDSVMVGPIDDLAIQVLREWAGPRDGAVIESQVLSARNQEGMVKLAKRPGAGGILAAPQSPLVRISVKACLNSFEPVGHKRSILHFVTAAIDAPFDDSLVICRYRFVSRLSRGSSIAYWKLTEDRMKRVEAEEMVKIQDWLDMCQLSEAELGQGDSNPVHGAVLSDYRRWLEGRGQGRERDPKGGIECVAIIRKEGA
ncbi:MAG: helicase-related protein [Nitrososphaerales archaeon]|jgi:superfamily II DNA or RNA helicase